MDGLPSTLIYGFIAGFAVITFFVIAFGLQRRRNPPDNWQEGWVPEETRDGPFDGVSGL